MKCNQIVFSGHGVQRMFTRSIPEEDVLATVQSGEVIVEYPDDLPIPSYLILGFVRGIPVLS